jgi:hypothetical protein
MKATIEGKVIEFCVVPQDHIESGELCLVSIGDQLTIGHYYPDVACSDWVVQDDRLIRIGDVEKQD